MKSNDEIEQKFIVFIYLLPFIDLIIWLGALGYSANQDLEEIRYNLYCYNITNPSSETIKLCYTNICKEFNNSKFLGKYDWIELETGGWVWCVSEYGNSFQISYNNIEKYKDLEGCLEIREANIKLKECLGERK